MHKKIFFINYLVNQRHSSTMYKNSLGTIFFFATVFSSVLLKNDLSDVRKSKTLLNEKKLISTTIQNYVVEYLDKFIEPEPICNDRYDAIKDFFTFNYYNKRNKKTIFGQFKKIWKQKTKDMEQLSQNSFIGLLCVTYTCSLLYLIVSVLVFLLVFIC